MQTIEEALSPYDYTLPSELIAESPASPRDSARLLVYNRSSGDVTFNTFHHITQYLPKNAVLVFNQTKVFPARFRITKKTGGAIEALYIETINGNLKVMASGKMAADDVLSWEDGHSFEVTERDGKYALLTPSFPLAELHPLLQKYGETPLPPYIKNSPLSEAQRRSEYQTVYATKEGSVAAPTAGLHFTPELLETIKAGGIDIAYVTLHVNLGTFAPVTDEHIKEKKLHEEAYEIDEDTAAMLNKAKKDGRPIIAVGTTTVRTLESAAQLPQHTAESAGVQTPYYGVSTLMELRGTTSIFITEHDPLHFVDGLITNFHVPKSSLLMLVSAFTGREQLFNLYHKAIEEEFRFFSFGDGMLIV